MSNDKTVTLVDDAGNTKWVRWDNIKVNVLCPVFDQTHSTVTHQTILNAITDYSSC